MPKHAADTWKATIWMRGLTGNEIVRLGANAPKSILDVDLGSWTVYDWNGQIEFLNDGRTPTGIERTVYVDRVEVKFTDGGSLTIWANHSDVWSDCTLSHGDTAPAFNRDRHYTAAAGYMHCKGILDFGEAIRSEQAAILPDIGKGAEAFPLYDHILAGLNTMNPTKVEALTAFTDAYLKWAENRPSDGPKRI